MKNKNLIIAASALAVIGILAIVLLKRRKMEEEKSQEEYTPEKIEAIQKVSNVVSSGTLKLR